jgi:thiol-disulfide isomerase/thioredoxin
MKVLSVLLGLGLALNANGCSSQAAPPTQDLGAPCDSSYPDGSQAVVRGHVMPNMKFETLDGDPFDLEEVRACGDDKILLLEPFPIWCTGCRDELPVLVELHQKLGDKGLRVVLAVGEDLDHQPATGSVVKEWVSHFAPDLEAWIDPERKLQDYTSLQTLPMSLVIDLDSMQILLKLTGGQSLDTTVDIIEELLNDED